MKFSTENKKLKIALVILVVVVYVSVYFRVKTIINPSNNIISDKKDIDLTISQITEIDSIKLALDYADPFLKKSNVIENKFVSSHSKNSISNEIRVLESKTSVNPSVKIYYGGRVNSKNKNIPTGIVRINDKNYTVTTNKSYSGVRIIAIYSDSIIVDINDSKFSIIKGKTI